MSGQWKEVIRLHFKGDRYKDHALDLSALKKLGQFQKLVAETAKELWRADNPDKGRLPRNFEDRTRLWLRTIEEGSAAAPLEVFLEEGDQTSFLERDAKEIEDAIDMTYQAFKSAEEDMPFPDRLPKALIPELSKWGQEIEGDEEIGFTPPGRPELIITKKGMSRIVSHIEPPHDDHAEISGEVLEADVKQGRFQLWIDDKNKVLVRFPPDQEETITSALKDHKTVKLEVSGIAEFSSSGKINEMKTVEKLQTIKSEENQYDQSAKPIGEILGELGKQVDPKEWQKLPDDMNENLDHYLYGTPKR